MVKKIFASILSFAFVGFLLASQAVAEEITVTVSENGSGSDNSVQVNSTSSTAVNQTNSADINNNLSGSANTGGNQASNNSSDVNIGTGDAKSSNTINNQNVNSNSYEGNCDCSSTNIKADISGNGAHSTNTLNLGVNDELNVSQSNSAQITNNVNTFANSGYNTANYNNGDVVIKTGKAGAYTNISNKNININVDPSGNGLGNILVSIANNGAGSINLSNIIFNSSFEYSSTNVIALFNNVINNANTGGNTANGNNGSVLIATGDAVSVVNIANENINGSSVAFCPTEVSPPPSGGNPETPAAPGPSSNSTIVQSAAAGVGAAIGTVLPATGGYFLLLMTILCLTIFLAGWYLRFGSGISPPFAYAA